jgi:hypothetical protein
MKELYKSCSSKVRVFGIAAKKKGSTGPLNNTNKQAGCHPELTKELQIYQF